MSRVWADDVRSKRAVKSEAARLPNREAEMAGQASGDEGSPPDSDWRPAGSDAHPSVRVPNLSRMAHLKPAQAKLILRHPHEIWPLVAEQQPSSTSEPLQQLRTATRPAGRSIRLKSFRCPSCSIKSIVANPEGVNIPLVEFVSGHCGFRCLQCGEPIIIEEETNGAQA